MVARTSKTTITVLTTFPIHTTNVQVEDFKTMETSQIMGMMNSTENMIKVGLTSLKMAIEKFSTLKMVEPKQ